MPSIFKKRTLPCEKGKECVPGSESGSPRETDRSRKPTGLSPSARSFDPVVALVLLALALYFDFELFFLVSDCSPRTRLDVALAAFAHETHAQSRRTYASCLEQCHM